MNPRFRPDNTEGYSAADLAWLNAEFERRLGLLRPAHRAEPLWGESYADHIAEQVLADYDARQECEP